MKATGFFELVILVTALVAGLPLFIACINMSYSGLNATYMDDKSTWRVVDDVEYTVDAHGILVPSGALAPYTLNAAQVATMSYFQDEYCPIHDDAPVTDAAVVVDINYDATTNTDTIYEKRISIPKLSRTSRATGNDLTKELVPQSSVATMRDKNFYIVWNKAQNTWMITNNSIDQFH